MFNPTLLAAVTLMLLTENPKRLMLGYLLGAYTASITIGLAIVFALHDSGAVSTQQADDRPGRGPRRSAGCCCSSPSSSAPIATSHCASVAKGARSAKQAKKGEKKEPLPMRLLGRGSPRIAFVVGAPAQLPRRLLSDRAQPHRQARRRGRAHRAAGHRLLPDAADCCSRCRWSVTCSAGADPGCRRRLPRLARPQRPPRRHLVAARAWRPPGHPRNRRAGELTMAKWGVLVVLGAAQFLMVLDQAVMNVAISQLVEDFDTTVTTIQAVIALYALVMAGLMLTGGKLGDIWGRRRAFAIGLCIYAVGSAPDRRLLERPLADARLVDPRGDRRGAGPAGAGRPRRRQLQGRRPGDRLRRARRRRRRRDRGRPDPRRLGDDRASAGGSSSSARSSSRSASCSAPG